uniref:Uncharacterized protein n=1 Tax=Coccidioides posadasii RMSCC 3488 TaxID=454284 RepID=A0A0J6I7W9_COCPO|nr:hypothetical protein CPAG_03896 [Coccidioides posadasii RMSCC 3488]
MNTIRSTWIGWGSLCVAGAGAYYFAKRSINADRLSRHEAAQRAKQEASKREAEARAPPSTISKRHLPFPLHPVLHHQMKSRRRPVVVK